MYGDDLAYVHGVGFADFSLNAGREILELFKNRAWSGGVVVDLGCGAGQWLHMLSNAGYDAIGLDTSRSFVRLAKIAAPDATVHVGSLWSRPIPQCNAVTALGEVVSYLPTDSRPPSLHRLFARVYAALNNDGLLVFDMLKHGGGPKMVYRSWKSAERWAVMVDVVEDNRKSRVYRTIETFRRHGRGYRRSVEHHMLRVVQRGDIVAQLRDIGFVVRMTKSLGDFVLPARRTLFVARKR